MRQNNKKRSDCLSHWLERDGIGYGVAASIARHYRAEGEKRPLAVVSCTEYVCILLVLGRVLCGGEEREREGERQRDRVRSDRGRPMGPHEIGGVDPLSLSQWHCVPEAKGPRFPYAGVRPASGPMREACRALSGMGRDETEGRPLIGLP